MIQYNEYLRAVAEVQKLGFPNDSDIRIPTEYLENKQTQTVCQVPRQLQMMKTLFKKNKLRNNLFHVSLNP